MNIYTGGTFDIFHFGHVRFLKWCRDYGDGSNHVTVSLNTDDFVERFKGAAPLNDFAARAEVLESCRHVDAVIRNVGGADSKPAILTVAPAVIIIGDDWAPPRDYFAQMAFTPDWLAANDIKLVYAPYTPGISSSALRRRIAY